MRLIDLIGYDIFEDMDALNRQSDNLKRQKQQLEIQRKRVEAEKAKLSATNKQNNLIKAIKKK